MTKEESCVNEKKGLLLQECLPGVTVHDARVYHQRHRRHPSYSSSVCSQELDQLQHNILVSNSMNKSRFNTPTYSAPVRTVELSVGDYYTRANPVTQTNCDDDSDDMLSFTFSMRQAAAVSESKRRTEELFWNYFVTTAAIVLCLLLLFGDQARNAKAGINPSNSTNQNHPLETNRPSVFRFFQKHQNSINGRFDFDSDGSHPNATNDGFYEGFDETLDYNKREVLVLLKDLDEAIRGNVFLRSNKTKFQNAARVWQEEKYDVRSKTSSSPLAVVEALTLHDVQLAVPILSGLASEYGIGFRIRSGGFAFTSGYSTITDGVVLSLANLNEIEMNPGTGSEFHENEEHTGIANKFRPDNATYKTIVMGPGVRMEDFMKSVLDENGYSSIVSPTAGVGMGGFLLGGGYGLQSRMFGLGIDNVVSLQVVLASGEIQNVSEGEDLFWAMCGSGGGNIGVATSMAYRVYPSHDMKFSATTKVTLTEMGHFLQTLGNKESEIASEFTLKVHGHERLGNGGDYDPLQNAGFGELLQDNSLVTVSMFWMGDSNPEDQVGMRYIKNEIIPLFPNTTTKENVDYYYFSWSGVSREREQPQEAKSVWSAQTWNGFLMPNSNTAEVWADIKSSLSALFEYCKFVTHRIELWGGAISKVPSNATVFPYRKAVYNIAIDLIVPTEGDVEVASDEMHLVNAIWPSIARHLEGAFVNYPMESLSNETYPLAYWGGNLNRLESLKGMFDPKWSINTAQGIPRVKKENSKSMRYNY